MLTPPPPTVCCVSRSDTCLEVLHEMLPLLGPLAPVLQNVHDALSLCLLSEQHYTDGLADVRTTSPPRSCHAKKARHS
jgi:hypothetical protein